MLLYQVEVESNLPSDFHSIKEENELGLDSGVKVEFNLRCFIGVNLYVSKARVLSSESLVISLNFFTDWVPLGLEVDTSENRSSLIEIFHNILDTLRHNEVFARMSDDGSLGNVD